MITWRVLIALLFVMLSGIAARSGDEFYYIKYWAQGCPDRHGFDGVDMVNTGLPDMVRYLTARGCEWIAAHSGPHRLIARDYVNDPLDTNDESPRHLCQIEKMGPGLRPLWVACDALSVERPRGIATERPDFAK
jgi:hypothetical protein